MCLVLMAGGIFLQSCHQTVESNDASEKIMQRVDSLEKRLTILETLAKPRLSVLMNRMQVHHSRMWEPGISGNWPLLKYEWAKTKETLSDIERAYGMNPHGTVTIAEELKKLESTTDSLESAINDKSKDDFVRNYLTLTTKCNSCHKTAGLDFYEIIKPAKPAYSSEIE
ncbi:MAG TPA: hypothetical protein PKD91_00095 [Bacteroidia bacterium]|nr:hypothetical protein [Bacteroidia bacterium]